MTDIMFNDTEIERSKALLTKSMIIRGDSAEVVKTLPDNFYATCITSPPYWGLRDYGYQSQIGAELELDDYINNLVQIFRHVRQKLKEDGTLWLNVGDSYTSGNRNTRAGDKKNPARIMSYRPRTPKGLKPKDLIGLPWRLAFALQQDGWYLRSDIVWNKPNCQPESVKDRPTQSHEYVFLFSKNPKYFYDSESIREPANTKGNYRNRRTVWSINTEPFPEAHFATFPEELIKPMILATTHENDFVLDPFFGSGTVGVSCKKNNRNYHGIELKDDYIKIAEKRISNVIQIPFNFT